MLRAENDIRTIDSNPIRENICAIIVTYNPNGHFHSRVENIRKQVGNVLIVDNHSNEETTWMLRGMTSNCCSLILNIENLGVATALNQGISWAKKNGFSWVVTLDQDTIVFDCMIEELLKTYNGYAHKNIVAVIGSTYADPIIKKCNSDSYLKSKELCLDVKTTITSGSLIPLRIIDLIGSFQDDLFIDLVDIEFCLRARSKGFKIIQCCKPVMLHFIGNGSAHKLFLRKTVTSNHTPTRRYFMMRNRIIVAKKYFFFDPAFVIKLLISGFKSIILFCLFERNKVINMRYSALGVLDGLLGKYDRLKLL